MGPMCPSLANCTENTTKPIMHPRASVTLSLLAIGGAGLCTVDLNGEKRVARQRSEYR